MNNKLEQCIHRVQDEMKTIESSLVDTGHHLSTAVEQQAENLEARWKNALAKCDAKREEAGQAANRVRQYLDEKKDELVSKFEDWKTDREIAKIESAADRKEQQAVDAVIVAAFAVLEAEVAIVEALRARKMAIEVAG